MTLRNRLEKWRWKKLKNGYILDKLIFNIFFYIIMIFLFSIVWSYDFDFSTQIYYKCDKSTPCENPFYDGIITTSNPLIDENKICIYEWCNLEYLPAGFEFGRKPGFFLKWAGLITLMLCVAAMATNHYIHNKNFNMKWPELEGNE